MTKSYPSGVITLNQFRRLVEGKEPLITYKAYDDSATFHLMGPLSPVVGVQEGVTILRDSLKGLMPSWRMLDQAGANQDGVTFNDAVYEPAEIDMVVEAHGNTAISTRQVIRDWVSSWDAHQPGELTVFTRENGMWWAPVRWLKAPGDPLMRAQAERQRFQWTCRIDDAFWRSNDSVASFVFDYKGMSDTFSTNYSNGLGSSWPLKYYGDADGYIYANGGQAKWKDDPNDPSFTNPQEVICGPYAGYNTTTDNQVISVTLGTIPEISLPVGAFNYIWGRMGRKADGVTWDGYGVRLGIGWGSVELRYFYGFNTDGSLKSKLLTARTLLLAPLPRDKFTLVCGYAGDSRLFRVLRNGVEILAHKESGNGSTINSSHRGVGFGMYAAGAILTQATPGFVDTFTAGTHLVTTQSSFVSLCNIGDVETWPRYLLYGPGTFSIGNGPNSEEMVEFGPLLDGQVVLIETEPRRRSVVDVSPSAMPAQVLNPFQELVKQLITYATNNNVPPFLAEFESMLGILPPQGNLYSFLNGRFTTPVPAKSPGELPTASQIRVKITDGNANSKIVAALTPRRRWPL